MSAVLSDLGIRGSRNDMLTMSVIVGTNSAMHSFRSHEGNGSSSHDLASASLVIFHISTSVASIKVVSGVPEKEVVIEPHLYKPGNPNSLLMFNICADKKPLLTLPMMKRRPQFCNDYLYWTSADWKTVIISDESTFRLVRGGSKIVRKSPGSSRYTLSIP